MRYGTEAYTRVHGSLGTLAVGYDDDSQLDTAEAETLEEGITQPQMFGHGIGLVGTFIKKHARKGGETRGSSLAKGSERRHPTASNPNAGLVQLAAFKPKEAWQALQAPVGRHLQAMIR